MREALEVAFEELRLRAEAIASFADPEAFWQNIPVHRQTLELANQWLDLPRIEANQPKEVTP